MLENSLFSDHGTAANPEFVRWAEDYVLFLHVTSYVFTDPHHDLFAERGGFGFPYLAILDSKGRWLAGRHGVLTLEQCGELAASAAALRRRSLEKDSSAQVEVFVTRLRNEALSYQEAVARRKELANDLSDAQVAEIDQLIVNREIATELAELRRRFPGHVELRRAAGLKAAELFRAGKVPTSRLAPHYMEALFGYARATGDRELFAEAVKKLEAVFADNEQYLAGVKRYRQQLEAWQ